MKAPGTGSGRVPGSTSRKAGGQLRPARRWPLLLLCGAGIVLLIATLNLWTAAVPAEGASTLPHSMQEGPITPIEQGRPLDARKVALGLALFEDPRLSGGGATPCSACHDLKTNGALAGPRTTRLDAPTVFNVGLNFRYGWEGNHRTLESHTLATVKSRMVSQGVPLPTIIERLRSDPVTRTAFRQAYGRDPDVASLVDAIATFERSLTTPGSRFDRWLAGDTEALTPREREGYALFRKLGCAACHQGRNVGGNLYQRQGIFRRLASPQPSIVRVPSLRNVATTAPYFHDGSAPTLEQAIGRMAYAQLDRKLTREEVDLVAAYLRSLTGTYKGRPVRAPQ